MFVLALAAASSMWFYVDEILVAHQIADAVEHERPRGNLSDLYPRWLGTRELLLHHRNPYSREVTLEVQQGYYGRELDPSRPNDPRDQESFAYPVYVVFLLAPLIGLPFHEVQAFFHWFLIGLTAISVWLWLRTLRWRLMLWPALICLVLTLGCFPVVQGIKLQQLSLLVAALLAGAAACAASGFLLCGGVLLAFATIKPQLAWPLVAWLILWAVSDWRRRRRFVFGFGVTMALLLAGAEIVLPGWWKMFFQGIGQYRQYTQSQSVLEVSLDEVLGTVAIGTVGRVGAQILAALAVLACGKLVWKSRSEAAGAWGFSYATALVLALTVLIVPMYAPYNQILLLPAILMLTRVYESFASHPPARRWAYFVVVLIVGWQWTASFLLTVMHLLGSHVRAMDRWQWPFFATFALPVWAFVLILFAASRQTDSAANTSV
jgi:hypothetical protein